MSGGSMNYLYSKVLHCADFSLDTPEREAFAKHLKLVAQALHDIEWVDSEDYGPGDENAAIRACLNPAPRQQAEPVEPVAWLRVIDEAMVTHHLGVADPGDDYETAKRKMNNLLCMAQDIGTYFAKQTEPAEPVARVVEHGATVRLEWVSADAAHNAKVGPLFSMLPQRKPLSEEEIIDATEHIDTSRNGYFIHIARAVERAHGITDPQVADRLARHGIPMPDEP